MSRALSIRKNSVVKGKSNPKIQHDVEWVVADISGSMRGPRLDAVNEMIKAYGENIHIAAFGEKVYLSVGPTTLYANGTTKMDLALVALKEYRPNYIVILSDGAVDDPSSTRQAAMELAEHSIIDTVYIGPDDEGAESFMKELAEIGSGRYKRYDMSKPQTLQLTEIIQGLLPPPEQIVEV